MTPTDPTRRSSTGTTWRSALRTLLLGILLGVVLFLAYLALPLLGVD